MGGGSTLGPSVFLGLGVFFSNFVDPTGLLTFGFWVVHTGGPHAEHRFIILLAHELRDLLILSLLSVPHE